MIHIIILENVYSSSASKMKFSYLAVIQTVIQVLSVYG